MIKLLSLVLIFIAAPVLMGLIPARFMEGIGLEGEKETAHPGVVYLGGLLFGWTLFQLCAVPVILGRSWGLTEIVYIYSGLLMVSSIAGAVLGRKMIPGTLRKLLSMIRRTLQELKASDGKAKKVLIETGIYWVIAVLLILAQMAMAFVTSSFDGDDAYYVAEGVIAEETDILYRILPYTGLSTDVEARHGMAPLPIWEAFVSRLSGIHVTIVCHSLLPLLLIPLTYLAWGMLGGKLFAHAKEAAPEKLPLSVSRATALFLILMSVLQVFGNTSIYTNATFFLMRTWQGKSVLCNLILALIFWLFICLWEQNDRVSAGWWIFFVTLNFSACLMTTMGAFLAALLVAVGGLVIVSLEKISMKTRIRRLCCLALCCLPNLVYLVIYALS